MVDLILNTFKGWLEPLLDRIRQDPTKVVSHLTDKIDPETFAYIVSFTGDQLAVGGFNWELVVKADTSF